jgi:hypothetical protein
LQPSAGNTSHRAPAHGNAAASLAKQKKKKKETSGDVVKN